MFNNKEHILSILINRDPWIYHHGWTFAAGDDVMLVIRRLDQDGHVLYRSEVRTRQAAFKSVHYIDDVDPRAAIDHLEDLYKQVVLAGALFGWIGAR